MKLLFLFLVTDLQIILTNHLHDFSRTSVTQQINAALHGHVRGERSRARQRKRCMDNVREDLEERGIQSSMAYGKTKNREAWKNIIRASSSAS